MISVPLDAIRALLHGDGSPARFELARSMLAPALAHCAQWPGTLLEAEDEEIIDGSLRIEGPLALENGAGLVVFGDLTVVGGIWSPPLAYTLVFCAGTLRAPRIQTSGEIFALSGIETEVLVGLYNDYSTYTPTVHCDSYVADDRFDVIGALSAKRQGTTLEFKNPEEQRKHILQGASAPARIRQASDEETRRVCARLGELHARIYVENLEGDERCKVVAERRALLRVIQKTRMVTAQPLIEAFTKNAPADWSRQDDERVLCKLRTGRMETSTV